MLKQQVQQLQHQLTVMSVSHSSVTPEPKKIDWKARPSPVAKTHTTRDSESYFCYRCGENGHIATHCTAPKNSAKVIQKLLSPLRKSKDDKASSKSSAEPKEVGSVRNGSVYTLQPCNLPEGLIGPSMMAAVKIDGQSHFRQWFQSYHYI